MSSYDPEDRALLNQRNQERIGDLARENARLRDLIRKATDLYPVFDILQELLHRGATIKEQDGRWHLFAKNGEGIISGRTFREMCVNLLLMDDSPWDKPLQGDKMSKSTKDEWEVMAEREAAFAARFEQKTLHSSDISGARVNVPDIKVVGNGDMFQLLCKASSQNEGWMKSTKAMEIPNGCVVQVTTQQRNQDGSYAVAEAVTFVPGVKVVEDVNGGRKLNC